MFGSEILDVAIGLVFVFLVVSLICSAIRELAEAWFKTRAVYLEQGLRQLLHDATGAHLVNALYNHPSVYGLYQGEYDPATVTSRGAFATTNLPTYIPAGNFAVAMFDLVARGLDAKDGGTADAHSSRITVDNLRSGIAKIGVPPVQRALLSALDMAEDDLDRARANVEAWYNASMDRVSGWYKRRTQAVLFALGLLTAVAVNANAVTIARYLYHDQGARAALVASATGTARDSAALRAKLGDVVAQLDTLDLPLGWQAGWAAGVVGARQHFGGGPASPRASITATPADVALAIVGWLLTACAVSFGAPFWFDLLNKFMVIRSTVKPHEKSPEEASDDRQRPEPRRTPVAAASPAGGGQASA